VKCEGILVILLLTCLKHVTLFMNLARISEYVIYTDSSLRDREIKRTSERLRNCCGLAVAYQRTVVVTLAKFGKCFVAVVSLPQLNRANG